VNAETCAVLASVFPLALITIVLESRSVHFNLRRRKFYREAILAGLSSSLVGLVAAVIGVAANGYERAPAIFVGVLFAISMVGLMFVTLGILATEENKLDNKKRKRS